MKYLSLVRGTALSASLAAPIADGYAATPIAYVGVAYGSSSSASAPVVINVPAGTQNGDLMLAYIATQTNNGAWLTTPPGWTQATKTFNSIQGSQLFWRVANNEPASYSWGGASYPQGLIKTYRNANVAAPIGGSAGCASRSATSCQIPAWSETAVAGEWYVGFWDFNTASAPISGPSDLGNVSRNLTQRSMFSGDKGLTASGNVTIAAETATVAAAANYWDAIAVTIEPAGSSAPTPPPSSPPPSSPTPPSTPTGSGVAALSANDFLNSLGIVSDFDPSLAPMVKYLGVRNIRWAFLQNGRTPAQSAAQAVAYAQAANAKIIWGLSSGWSGTSVANDIAAAKQVASAGYLLAIEGPNEPATWPITYNGQVGGKTGTWLPLAKLQRDLYAAAKADSVLKNYPVFNLSGSGPETDNVGVQFLKIPPGAGTLMPDGTQYADYANQHNYVIWTNAKVPVDNAAWNEADPINDIPPQMDPFHDDYGVTWLRHYQGYSNAQLPSIPRVTTETGWWNGSGGDDNQAKILLNVYLSQFKRGYKYTFLYDLMDTIGEQFGLYRSDKSARPAATYIHNLTTILNDDKAVGATTGALAYSIPNEPATVHDLLLQKSTGAFELIVWDERPVGEATDQVTVSLGGTHASVKIYDPTAGVAATKTLSNVSSVPLTLSDHPMIIEIAK